MEAQIGFMLGGCAGEGITIGVNLSEPGDEQGKGPDAGEDAGETGQEGGLAPGQGTKAEEEQGEGELASTPEGRVFTWHYLTESGPERHIPGSVVDETIDHHTEKEDLGDRTVYYDAKNDMTVVQSDTTGRIISAHRGKP
jgi:hypothetical protein